MQDFGPTKQRVLTEKMYAYFLRKKREFLEARISLNNSSQPVVRLMRVGMQIGQQNHFIFYTKIDWLYKIGGFSAGQLK